MEKDGFNSSAPAKTQFQSTAPPPAEPGGLDEERVWKAKAGGDGAIAFEGDQVLLGHSALPPDAGATAEGADELGLPPLGEALAGLFIEAPEEASDLPDDTEWESNLEAEFRSKDRNNDGVLSMKEVTIKELLRNDVDKNGRIDFTEFREAFIEDSLAEFRKLDTQRDERLSLEEFCRGAVTEALQARFMAIARRPAAGLALDEYRTHLSRLRLGR